MKKLLLNYKVIMKTLTSKLRVLLNLATAQELIDLVPSIKLELVAKVNFVLSLVNDKWWICRMEENLDNWCCLELYRENCYFLPNCVDIHIITRADTVTLSIWIRKSARHKYKLLFKEAIPITRYEDVQLRIQEILNALR